MKGPSRHLRTWRSSFSMPPGCRQRCPNDKSTKACSVTDSASLFTRHPGNPLLAPERWPYTVNAVMNPGATRVDDETVLLCRVEDRRGFSHLTCARSRDGISNWVVDEHPALAYDPAYPEEE